jgi:MinD-like ATPase involved in chromosome partitioning or flagellar assembly
MTQTLASIEQPLDLSAFDFDLLVPARPAKPQRGWRRVLLEASRGLVNVGPSAAEIREATLAKFAQVRIGGARTVIVASGKGGVGKTTVSAYLGSRLAQVREGVVVIDANPDAGNLAWRLDSRHNQRSLADLLDRLDRIDSLSDIREFTTLQDAGRLEVIASPKDPSATEALGTGAYERILGVLRLFYQVVICDCGTGLWDGHAQLLVRCCDQAVVVSSPSRDGAEVVAYTLDVLQARRGADWLRENVLVVINGVRNDTQVDVARLEAYFSQRVHQVHRIAWDPYMHSGGKVDWTQVGSQVRDDYLVLAAMVGMNLRSGDSHEGDVDT